MRYDKNTIRKISVMLAFVGIINWGIFVRYSEAEPRTAIQPNQHWQLRSAEALENGATKYLPQDQDQVSLPEEKIAATGKIAFVRVSATIKNNGNTLSADSSDIYVMNPDGSGIQKLTDKCTFCSEPTWSPDGTKIAFTKPYLYSPFESRTNIYVMGADGSNVRKLTSTFGESNTSPTWSPDGNKIAFANHAFGQYGIWVINADGSGQKRITQPQDEEDGRPSWSPDGKHIAFVRRSQSKALAIFSVNIETNQIVQLTFPGSGNWDLAPAWAPTGKTIAFVRHRFFNEGASQRIYIQSMRMVVI